MNPAAEEEEATADTRRPARFDAGTLSVEISGGGSGKRTIAEDDEPVKKIKTDDRTIMTGLTDKDVETNIKMKKDNTTEQVRL